MGFKHQKSNRKGKIKPNAQKIFRLMKYAREFQGQQNKDQEENLFQNRAARRAKKR